MPKKTSKLQTWIGQYEQHVVQTHRKKNAERKLRAMEYFFSRFQDRRKPEDIFASDVRDYISIRVSEGLSPRTVAVELSVVRNFYDWLRFNRKLDILNPAKNYATVSMPSMSEAKFSIFTVDELIKVFVSTRVPAHRVFILLGVTCGLRLFEIKSLTWEGLKDIESGYISVGERRIPIRQDLRDLLVGLRDEHQLRRTHILPETCSRWWPRILRESAVPYREYSALRNTLAVLLVRLKGDVQSAKILLGSLEPLQQALELESETANVAQSFLESLPKFHLPPEDNSDLDADGHPLSSPRIAHPRVLLDRPLRGPNGVLRNLPRFLPPQTTDQCAV